MRLSLRSAALAGLLTVAGLIGAGASTARAQGFGGYPGSYGPGYQGGYAPTYASPVVVAPGYGYGAGYAASPYVSGGYGGVGAYGGYGRGYAPGAYGHHHRHHHGCGHRY